MGAIIRNGIIYSGGGVDPDMIAPTFSATQFYFAGQYVIYQNELYTFLENHDAGAWTGTDVSSVNVADELDKIHYNFAMPFNQDRDYAPGDYVVYNGTLYKFRYDHTAGDPWDNTELRDSTINDVIFDIQYWIAPIFDMSDYYLEGDMVFYEGELYIFRTDHDEGEWDEDEVVSTKISDVIDEIADDLATAQASLPVKTTGVSALTGATTVTISNANIHTTSFCIPFSDNGTNTPITWKTMTQTEGQVVLTFDALSADTTFYLTIMN